MTADPRTVRHGHSSGRFDVDPQARADFLAALVVSERLSLLTTTEDRHPAILKALRTTLPEHVRASRSFEYLYIWDTRVYRSHWAARLAALDPRRWPMLGGRRMFRVARKRLTHIATETRLRAEISHAPSGVSAGPGVWDKSQPKRVKISQAGFARWGRRIATYRDRHPRGVLVAHMDSNLDQFRQAWRGLLIHQLGCPSVWTGHLDRAAGGTHGSRLIDTAHVLGELHVTSARVYQGPRPLKVDHKPLTYSATY